MLPVCAKELTILIPLGPDFKPFVLIESPLVSLMQDQVATLRDKGVRASCVLTTEITRWRVTPAFHNLSTCLLVQKDFLGLLTGKKAILSNSFWLFGD